MTLPFQLCCRQHTLSPVSVPLSAVPLGDIPWFWHLPLERSLTSLGFIFTASHNGLSGAPLPHLASEALLNPRGRFPQSFSSVFLITVESEQYGQHCQETTGLLWGPGPGFSEAFLCYHFLGTKNSPGLSYLPMGRFAFYFLIVFFSLRTVHFLISFPCVLFSIMDLL